MRRKPGTLLPLEVSILEAALELRRGGEPEFHGYSVARTLKYQQDGRRLTAHGTLYRALDRLAKAGFLESRWEDPLLAAAADRPRRRLYHVTAVGEQALAAARPAVLPAKPAALKKGLSPT